jgi:small subunit ribosomal protein S20
MANHKSAKKRVRTNAKKAVRNKAALSKVKTLIKKVYATEEPEQAKVTLKEAVSFLDKTAGKGRIHKNNVARKKSALTRHVNKLTTAK